MYLAYKTGYEKKAYVLRTSYYDDVIQGYKYKDVFDLGEKPEEFIHEEFVGCFYFDDRLEKAVEAYVQKDVSVVLENLLYQFLSYETKQYLEKYPTRQDVTISPLTEEELAAMDKEIHLFDLKRLYFLRYGAVDQAHLYKLHKKLVRKLLNMSRDEKEFFFIEQEKDLSVIEFKTYVYAIFNLQDHFSQSFAPFMPGALPQHEIEEVFIKELCKLNANKDFLAGETSFEGVYSHLVRYVIMFFDYEYEEQSYVNDFIHKFRASNREFKWPESKQHMDEETLSELFGKPVTDLFSMDKRQITKLYRKKALKLHPDQGGDHEIFIKLTEAYKQLLNQKND